MPSNGRGWSVGDMPVVAVDMLCMLCNVIQLVLLTVWYTGPWSMDTQPQYTPLGTSFSTSLKAAGSRLAVGNPSSFEPRPKPCTTSPVIRNLRGDSLLALS